MASRVTAEALDCLSADTQAAVRETRKFGYDSDELIGWAWQFEQEGYSGAKLRQKLRSAIRNEHRYGGNRSGGCILAADDLGDHDAIGQADQADYSDPAAIIEAAREVIEQVRADSDKALRLISLARADEIDCTEFAAHERISKRRAQLIKQDLIALAGVQLDLFDEIELEQALELAGVEQ
jgi:hypothetical protein